MGNDIEKITINDPCRSYIKGVKLRKIGEDYHAILCENYHKKNNVGIELSDVCASCKNINRGEGLFD